VSDIFSESSISIGEAAKLFPGRRPGKTLNFSTIWRWIRGGIRTRSGQVVRLEACRLGARWVTSREAIARFSARLTRSAASSAIATPGVADAQAPHP
jgi:Protein of unknown function (DUF1580)